MKKVLLIIVLLSVLAVLLPLGYLLWQVNAVPRYDPATMEGMAQEWVSNCGTAQPAIAFEIIERRETARGILLLFEASCLSVYRVVPYYGFLFGRQIGPGQLQGGGSYGMGYLFALDGMVEYSVDAVREDDWRSSTVVHGRSLVPEVVTVEATFDSGTVVRDDATDGFFALLDFDSGELQRLRVLDADGKELATMRNP